MVVVGAGAAGIMAAIFAAERGAETRLLERTRDGGRKILISGGGRCNILPARLDERRFVTDSSNAALRKIVRSWPLAEQVAFFERELGLRLVEEAETAKLFPSTNRARDVRDGLLRAASRRGVGFLPGVLVTGIAPADTGWRVECDGGSAIPTDAVVVATGGLSVPNTGSDGRGLEILRGLGHTIHPTYPALTPITSTSSFTSLAGVSATVTVRARSDHREAESRGGLLFTHRGYSGPAILDVSHVLVRAREEGAAARLEVQWTGRKPADWEAVLQAGGTRRISTVLRESLPARLADLLLARLEIDPAGPLAQLRREERRRLVDQLAGGELPWTGDEGYAKAEVTGGGVSLAEVHPGTMESRRTPGLHICGEALDAFGPIGGYNFLWAWVTGKAAGIAAAGISAVSA